MIVIDTSAVVAIIQREPDADTLIGRLGVGELVLPASCYLEAAMVLIGRRPDGRRQLDMFLATYAIRILGSDATQALLAADAFERYGRGSGHPARLNFGDCLAYAAAAASRAPLIYKGDDFARTDVVVAP